MTTIVGQAVQLQLRAVQADWAGLFDRLQVWRSTSGADGPYVELTAPTWLGARVPADVVGDPPSSPPSGPSAFVVGMTASFLIDETTHIDVTFTGSNPITRSQAASQIVAQSRGMLTSFVTMDGRLVVQSVEAGNKAILRVLATDAAALLGLPTTDPAWANYGKDARIVLRPEQELYPFVDWHSGSGYFYKTRFSSDIDNTVSDFSLPFTLTTGGSIDPSSLVLGTVDLVDVQGRAVQNREVTVYSKFQGNVINGRVMTSTDARVVTDADGHAEFLLVRGAQVTVSVAGTQLARDLTVPTDPTITSFNLLDPSVGSDDVFVVQVPNIDFAVRRSL